MDTLDVPPSYAPPPPPKKINRPTITLQIPESITPMTARGQTTAGSVYWGPSKYHGKSASTPASRISDPHSNPYFNPFLHMYHNKASEFVFKQFEGFKDFTMNTAKSGLSAGEKSAFWFYNKLRLLSRRWFTHLFLTLCLVLYSLMGAAMFMALEGPNEKSIVTEEKTIQNLTTIRRDVAARIHDIVIRNNSNLENSNIEYLTLIEQHLIDYELNYTEHMNQLKDHNVKKRTWTFWNSMYYAGTIYTTIGMYISLYYSLQRNSHSVVMSNGENKKQTLTSKIPIIKTESETQTVARLVTKSPERREAYKMESAQDTQGMSLRKRRNLSKNRAQATRQREKTPEPNRTHIPHEDTTTSDDEDIKVSRNSREIEADNTYEEMRRLVLEKSQNKDPVYDLDTDKVLEERAFAANERRRRSISPFALPEKEEFIRLERKGSFIDPGTKLLSTNYIVSPKDEETRRSSLVIEPQKDSRSSLSSLSPPSSSTKDTNFPYPMPSTPKKLDEIVYPDEKQSQDISKKPKTPVQSENVFTYDEKDIKQNVKQTLPKTQDPPAGNVVTKVIQVERTPSKKLTPDKKPEVEVREKVVRTSSTKKTSENKSIVQKQSNKNTKSEVQSKVPPVKPARSKSASRFANKTSESEMSEDQANQLNLNTISKRKSMNVPRRFVKHSPRLNRSQSMHRTEDLRVIDRTGTGMSQTSREIIELMQKARARSLSIPKDDPRLPSEYKNHNRNLKTPNKTPSTTPRNTRGISCPKTIQIISDREILSGLTSKQSNVLQNKHSRQSSGYIDASQSEYTSSCYSSSPSENEYDFDLSERTAELTHKLNILSQEVDTRETMSNIIFASDDADDQRHDKNDNVEQKSVLRKRSVADAKTRVRRDSKNIVDEKKVRSKVTLDKTKNVTKPRWKLVSNWQTFKQEHKLQYDKVILLRNKCICNMLMLIMLCGLGGIMFKALEGSFENAYKCGTRNVKRDFIENLWRGSHYLREEDWKSMARKKLYEFEEQLHTAHEAGVTSYSGQRSWNFMNSFVYCLTLVTTIGYGHIAPKTVYGRVATIVYAIIGIPLFLIILADFGKLFTRIIKFFWAFIRRFYYTRSCRKVRRTAPMQEVMKGLNIVYDVVRRPSQIFSDEDIIPDHPPPIVRKPSDVPPPLPPKPGTQRDQENETEPGTPAPSVFEIDDEFNLPISVAIFILAVYIIIGAVAYNLWENWTFFESFYFVFISMSTIGLGDLVPDHPMYMMASILYLIFGLALTSMCINVVQVKLSNTFKQASAKLGATIGLKVAEEDGSLVPITPPPTEIAPVHKSKFDVDVSKNNEELQNVTKNS